MNTMQTTEANETRTPLAPIPEWLEMSKEEREEKLRIYYGDIEYVYLAEAERALEVKDRDGFWQWCSLTELPAHSLAAMKVWYGADFIRGTGFGTSRADKAYGPGGLEQ